MKLGTDIGAVGFDGMGAEDAFPNAVLGAGEPDRLAALEAYRILDTAEEASFDGIARLATKLCGTPVGLITLVTADRQWFKARIGFDEAETPLDSSICVHALSETGLLIIPDLTDDPRTRTNPAVTGPSGLRFYAGIPLRAPSGHGLGTLCVIDRQPRGAGLTLTQSEALRALGEQVMALMEARRALRAQEEASARLQESEAFLMSVLAASPDCIKVLDREGHLTFMNAPGLCLMEIDDLSTVVGTRWDRLWKEPYAEKARAALAAARGGGIGRFAGWADTRGGVPKFWNVTVTPIEGVDGQPERLLAVSRDETGAYEAARRQEALTTLGGRLRELNERDDVLVEVAQAAVWALRLTRAAYGTVDASQSSIAFTRDFTRPGQASVVGLHRYADYGTYVEDLRLGKTVAIADVRRDPRTASNPEALTRYGIGALLNVPAMAGGRLVGVLCLHDGEPRAWTDEERALAEAIAERARLALTRIDGEEQQRLRVREISHRFKNLLAVVQAITTQTLRSATDLASASDILAGRLIALGQSQDLLLEGEIGGSPIRDLMARALHLDAEMGLRFDLRGPDLRIGAKVALAFSLMLHELATNAIKYGALSNATGRVGLSWALHGEGDAARLRLTWHESGGPPVAPPSRKGFGSRLIERGLAGQVAGTVEALYRPTGFLFTVEAPLIAFQVED